MLIKPYNASRELSTVAGDFSILYDGTITDSDGNEYTLEEFREISGILVNDIKTLLVVGHQFFNWAPAYWPCINVVCKIEGLVTAENLLATLPSPVESCDYPGHYLIPYYSNYLITKDGRLLKKSANRYIVPSKAVSDYVTFRMEDDSGNTQNRLRHRIMGMTFLPYNKHMEDLVINHINGIKGDDRIENLEWVTSAENADHAVTTGLQTYEKIELQARDCLTGKVFIFPSLSSAGRYFSVEASTMGMRCKSAGNKCFDGYQFRYHPNDTEWPEIDPIAGKYRVEFPTGEVLYTGCKEAARRAGVTRTSLMRMLREGRHEGPEGVKVYR